MKGFKTLINILMTTLITALCWIPFYLVGPKTILTGGLTMVVGFLLSTIIYQYVAKRLDKRLEDIKDTAFLNGMLQTPNIVEKRNPRWARKDTPIYDDEGKEIGTSTNYQEMRSVVDREFKERV
jgi:hypothetical protein